VIRDAEPGTFPGACVACHARPFGQNGCVTCTGGTLRGPVLRLPSTGPDPIPLDTAAAAVLGYARGQRAIRFRSPAAAQGQWVQVPAFGWSRFDTQPIEPPGDRDVLVAEGLHGRLDPAGWEDVYTTLGRVGPILGAVVERAAGRSFWELPADELSVLEEPGTVGAGLRRIGHDSGKHPAHVAAALHHRHPGLVPHITRSTRRALLPHLEEGDSGVEAVVGRELRANERGFTALEDTVAALLGEARPTRVRLHDILLWLATTLRMTHAVHLGRGASEWAAPAHDGEVGRDAAPTG
jgi:hypothetical protein